MKLKTLLTSLAFGATLAATASAPKYIFYFIGDGMGMGPVLAASTYSRVVLGQENLPLMMTFPVAGQVMTYSASGPVTDSAAAGTALSTSHKTRNGMLGMDADTVSVSSMADVLKQHGYGVGVVTSVAPDDATPGAFYAHVPNRMMSTEINRQFATANVDFLAGTTLRGVKDKEGNDTGVLDLYDKNNVTVVRGLDALAKADTGAGKVVLLGKEPFEAGNMGYTIDSIPGMLTLPQMTEACLGFLEKRSPDHFFMMVEGGNIDHALHGNDGGAAIIEILNFNEAIDIAYQFYLKHPDETLIVVTADHDTGGMSVGNRASGMKVRFDYLTAQRVSKEMFSDYCKSILKSRRIYKWEDMKEYLTENFGFWTVVPVTEAENERLHKAFVETFEDRNSKDEKTWYSNFNAFAADVFNILSAKSGIGWTSNTHTGNPVPIYAIGAGASRFAGLNNNSAVPVRILDAAGYKF